jgi:cell division protein FtsW (lipid II flippase)
MKFPLTAPSLWLIICVLAGIANMAAGSAPPHYMAINAVALAAALAMIRFVPTIKTERAAIMASAFVLFALGLPLLIGPELEGVRRWIGLGPVQLHSGMFVLPMLFVLLPRLQSAHALAATAVASILISLQPDRASAIALLAGTGALLFAKRSAPDAVQLLCAGLAVGVTIIRPDVLEPVAFVENVLPDAWLKNRLLAAALAASLAATVIMPAIGNRSLVPVTATLAGFAIASLTGAYPVPLIGYGAAAIIGFGLAIAAARQPVP